MRATPEAHPAVEFAAELLAPEAGALHGADAFAALDSPALFEDPAVPSRWETELRPLLYENIGWFIGTLFILAGSIYGVREAWRTLDGLWRHLVVALAFTLYHAGFAGLARLLAPRSASTGRVLAGISMALLPVVFVSLASLVAVSPAAGLVASTLVTLVSWRTLASAARRFDLGAPSGFSRALVPSLLAELPVLALAPAAPSRWLLPFVALAALAQQARALAQHGGSTAPLFASLYGGFALSVLCLVGAPDRPPDPTLAASASSLWAASLCALTAYFSARPSLRERFVRGAVVADVGSLALLAALTAASASRAFSLDAAPVTVFAAIASSALCAWVFASSAARHPAALHVALPAASLTAALAARALTPDPGLWLAAIALPPAALGVIYGRPSAEPAPADRTRTVVLRWAAALSIVSLALTSPRNDGSVLLAGAAVALGAHWSAARGAPWMHFLGAVGALAGGVEVLRGALAPSPLPLAATVLMGVYGLGGVRAGPAGDKGFAPLDDLSILMGALGAVALTTSPLPVAEFVLDRVRDAGPPEALVGAALGVGLMVRSARDRSRGVAMLGATVGAWAAGVYASPATAGQRALTAACVALGAAVMASLRDADPPASVPRGRALVERFTLPWNAPWRTRLADGFAFASALAAGVSVAAVCAWFGARVEPERWMAVRACEVLALTGMVGFVTRAFERVRLRGRVGALVFVGLFVALGAVANRLGRPLPPEVVGLRLTVILALLWGFGGVLDAYGPKLSARMGTGNAGRRWSAVPFAGVFVLGALLLLDAAWIFTRGTRWGLARTPPLMPWGSALAWVLLARTTRERVFYRAAAPLVVCGAALAACQGSVVGVTSAAINDPLSLVLRATEGATMAVLALAVFTLLLARSAWSRARLAGLLFGAAGRDANADGVVRTFAQTALAAACVVALQGWWSASLLSAGMLVVAGAVLVVARERRPGVLTASLGAALAIHAWSCGQTAVPVVSGAMFAALSLGAALSGPRIVRVYNLSAPKVYARTHALAAVFAVFGGVYALAEGARPAAGAWGSSLAVGALVGTLGGWRATLALPLASGIVALACAAVCAQSSAADHDDRASFDAVVTAFVTAFALDTAALVLVARGASVTPSALASGTLLALCNTVVALGAHGVARTIVAPGVPVGARVARDWLLAAAGVWAGLFVLALQDGGDGADVRALAAGLGALATAVAISLDAAWRESSARHVYFVQGAVVGGYALIRAVLARGLTPEFDAVCALALGFVLVGVTVQARRAGLTQVATATRRFAALLPLVGAVVLPDRISPSAALAAAGASVLYAALGYVERSRWLGSLGAAAANVALLVAALSGGLAGVEVYLGPLGLFVLCLGQLFGATISRPARGIVRLLGSLLLYLPSAAQLALQVGNAQHGEYPVLFGLVCLAGVAAGMILHIRAYLALGLLFLVLDVVESLVHAGLRDHRVGFLILSLAGLGILGAMVVTTLQREAFRAWVARVRAVLGAWD